MSDRFSGDPKLYLTADGADLNYQGGQPVMDQGFENQAQISLFTRRGWCGNVLFPDTPYGSDFMDATEQPLTLASLNDIRDAAEKALEYEPFGNISSEVNNPTGYNLSVINTIKPVGQDIQTISVSRNGLNWINQNIQGAR